MTDRPFARLATLVVVDASKDSKGDRPPFAEGASVTVERTNAAGMIKLVGIYGLWRPERFKGA